MAWLLQGPSTHRLGSRMTPILWRLMTPLSCLQPGTVRELALGNQTDSRCGLQDRELTTANRSLPPWSRPQTPTVTPPGMSSISPSLFSKGFLCNRFYFLFSLRNKRCPYRNANRRDQWRSDSNTPKRQLPGRGEAQACHPASCPREERAGPTGTHLTPRLCHEANLDRFLKRDAGGMVIIAGCWDTLKLRCAKDPVHQTVAAAPRGDPPTLLSRAGKSGQASLPRGPSHCVALSWSLHLPSLLSHS